MKITISVEMDWGKVWGCVQPASNSCACESMSVFYTRKPPRVVDNTRKPPRCRYDRCRGSSETPHFSKCAIKCSTPQKASLAHLRCSACPRHKMFAQGAWLIALHSICRVSSRGHDRKLIFLFFLFSWWSALSTNTVQEGERFITRREECGSLVH